MRRACTTKEEEKRRGKEKWKTAVSIQGNIKSGYMDNSNKKMFNAFLISKLSIVLGQIRVTEMNTVINVYVIMHTTFRK